MNAVDKWTKRELKNVREYAVKRKADGVIDDNRNNLAKSGSGERDLALAVRPLDSLSNWYGAVGCVAVLDGDESGFESIDRACLYNFWAIRIMSRGYDLDQRPDKQPRGLLVDRIATTWMHAEAIGATSIREELDALVVRIAEGYAGASGREMNALCTLVAHYATKRDAAELERGGWAPIGIYRAAASGTVDYDQLATYHQQNVDGSGYPPFHAYPYRLAALELLAIARRTGVPVAGRNPLITSPLARARDAAQLAVPDELAPIVARAARDFGI